MELKHVNMLIAYNIKTLLLALKVAAAKTYKMNSNSCFYLDSVNAQGEQNGSLEFGASFRFCIYIPIILFRICINILGYHNINSNQILINL